MIKTEVEFETDGVGVVQSGAKLFLPIFICILNVKFEHFNGSIEYEKFHVWTLEILLLEYANFTFNPLKYANKNGGQEQLWATL